MFRVIKFVIEAVDTDDSSDSSTSCESEEEVVNDVLDMSTSSDEEEPKNRRSLHRIQGFVELVVPLYDEVEFKEHFRLRKTTVAFIIETVRQAQILPTHSFGRQKIGVEKAVLMTLWYVSNTETFRQISDRFNVTRSSAHRIITKVINFFVSVSKRFIKWPDNGRQNIIREEFRSASGINGIVGAIDGCHINIKKPTCDAYVYCNRKSEYSILLQAVCDHQKKFIDFFCGEAGSLHDARLLRRSSIYEKGINGIFGNDFLLGDSAYPCLPWLIPPYRDNGRLTRNHRTFNYRHSAVRVVIEHAFGLLKGRFRRLRSFENENIMFIVKCVVAAGVLHNICIDFDDEEEYNLESDDCDPWDDETISSISGIQSNEQRRNEIFHEMFNV